MAKKLLNTQEDFKNWAAQQFGNQAAPATGAASANTGAGKTQAQQEQSVRNEALERLKGESQMEQPEDLEKAIDRHIKGQLFPGYENSDKSVLEQIADNAFQAFPSAMRALREQIGGIFGGNGGQQEQKPGTKFTFAGGNKAGAAQAEAPREYTGDEVNDAVKHIDELLSDKNLSWEDKIALQSDRNLLTDYAGGVVQHDAANNESVGAVIGRWGSRKAPETPETTFSFGSSLVADEKRLEALKAEREELISATMQYPLRVTDMAAAGEAAKRLSEILPQIQTLEGQVAQKQQDEQARQEAARESAKTDVERFLEGRMSQEEFNQLPESDRNEVMAMYHVYGEDGAQQVLNRLNDEKQVYTAMGLTAQEFSDLRPELREEALRTWREDASHAGFYSMLAREDWSYGSDVFKPGSKSAAADQMELADRDAKKRQEEGDKLAADMEEERLRARYESMTPKDAADAVRKIDEQLEAIRDPEREQAMAWIPLASAYTPSTRANIEKLTQARDALELFANGETDFDGMAVADLIDQADAVIGDAKTSEAALRKKTAELEAERDKYKAGTPEWKEAQAKVIESERLAEEAYRVENPAAYFMNNDLIRYRDAAISAGAPAMENMVGMYLKTPVDMAYIAQDLWDYTLGQIKQDRIDKDGNIRYGIPDVIRATTGYKSATDNPVINALKTASDTFLKKAEIDNKRSVAEWTDLMVEQGVKKEDAQRYADLVITKGLTSAGASLGFMLPGMKYRGPVNPSNLASVIKSPQYWMMAAQTAGAGIREDHELLGNNYTVFDMAANFINGIANSAIELYDPLDIDIFRYLGRKLDLPDFVGSAVSSGAGESGEEILQEGVERGIKVGADVLSGRQPRFDPTLSVENLTKSGTLFSLADYGDIGLNTFISTQGINLMNAVGTRAAYATQNPYKAAVLATLDGTATEEQKDLAGRVAVAAAAVDAVAEQQEQKANGGAPTEQQQHDAFEEGLTGQGAPEDTQPAVNPIQVLDEQRRAGRVKKPAGAADALRRAAEDAQKGKFLPPEQVQQIVEEQSGDKAGEKPGLPELPENDRDQYDWEESNQQLQDLQTEAERPGEAQATRDQEPQPTTTWRDEQKKKLKENPEPVPVPARPEMREAEQKAPETMERPAAPERLVRPMDASGTGEAMDALVAAAQARTGNQHLSPEEVQAAVAAAQGGMEQTAQAAEETGKDAEEAAGAHAEVDQDEKLDTEVIEPQQGEQESDRLDTDVTQPEEKAAESDRLDTDVNEPREETDKLDTDVTEPRAEDQESDRLDTNVTDVPQGEAPEDQDAKLETETNQAQEQAQEDQNGKLETETGEPPEEQESDNARLDTETEQPQEQETANADARSDTEINDVTAAASAQETTAGTRERSGSAGSGGGVSVSNRVQTSGQVNLERKKADLQYDSDGIELYSSREKTAQLLNQAQGLSDDLRQAGLHFASWSGGTQMDAETRTQMTVMNDYLKKIGYSAVMDSEITNGKGSYANGSYTYSDVNGHKVIHIAQNSKNPFITVLSHELTHALRTNNPGAYVDLKRAFIKYAQNAGLDVGALVKAKMDLYERHGEKLNGLDEETGYNAEALEEVIADAMYDVIGDEQAIKSLAAKNPGLIQSIKNWITETLDKIHQLLNGYADKTPQAKMLRDQAGALEELRGIMNDALTETRPIREEKARVANVGSNGELTDKFQEKIRESEGREEMNKAAGELADGILKGQGLEASLGNRQRLYTAAGDFMLSGGTISEAMELFDLKWTAGTAEQNRAFAALGKYVQGLMERNDVEGYQGLMEEDGDTSSAGQSPAPSPQGEGNAAAGTKWSYKEMTRLTDITARDQEYMEAVKSGDEAKQRRMVKEAAEAAGYTLYGYHGTKLPTLRYDAMGYGSETDYENKRLPFTVFKPGQSGGIYVATNREASEGFARNYRDKHPGTVMSLYVRMENPLVVNEHVWTSVPHYYNIPTPTVMLEAGYPQKDLSTEEISHFAQEHGYDGVIIEGIREGADIQTDDIIPFSPEQLKLADPVVYDDAGNVIPLSERFNKGKEDIRYSITDEKESFALDEFRAKREAEPYQKLSIMEDEDTDTSARDQEYLEAVESGDEAKQRRMVKEAAEAAGYDTKTPLYHGTQRFGFTQFNTDVIFASSSESVASGYGNIARQRKISERYVEDNGDPAAMAKNARNVLGSEVEPLNAENSKKVMARYVDTFKEANQVVHDAMDNLPEDFYKEVPPEIETELWDVVGLFDYLLDDVDGILDRSADERKEYLRGILVYDNPRESYDKLHNYYSEHREELKDTAFGKALRNLFKGYTVGDALIEYEYGFKKLMNGEAAFHFKNTGGLISRDELRNSIRAEAGKGIYKGFGRLGDNPLIVDARHNYWLNIPFEGKKVSTDEIVNLAKKRGYTGVVIKDVMDPSVVNAYGDDYVFFGSDQFKSADPVTYDDNGQPIPLSERFNKGKEDIRYSITDEKESFALDEPVEETRDLVAVHSLSVSGLEDVLKSGKLVAPSIAVMQEKDLSGNKEFGPISIIFGKDTIDPEANPENRLYGNDAWTARYPESEPWESMTPERALERMKKQPEKNIESIRNLHNAAAKAYNSIDQMKGDTERLKDVLIGNDQINDEISKEILVYINKDMLRGEKATGRNMKAFLAAAEELSKKENSHLLDGRFSLEAAYMLQNILPQHGWNATRGEIIDVLKYINRLANVKTEYFEAKPMRMVSTDEWAAVVIPTNDGRPAVQKEYDDAAKKAEAAGLTVLRYDARSMFGSDRSRVINAFADEQQIKFSMMDQQGDDAQQGRTAAEAEERESFALDKPVEETRELVAVHNLNEEKLEKALEDGGLIGPSIAVMKKQTLGANNHYGDISIIFRRDTIDPDVSEGNRLYGADAWTPMYDSYHDYENPEDVLDDMKRQPERGYEAGAEYVSGNLEDMDNAAAKIYRNVREMKDDSGRIQYDLFGNIKRNKQRLINEAKEMGFREEGQQTLVDIATLMTTRENLDLLKGEEPSEAAKRLIRRNLHSLRSDEEITKIYKLIRSFANLPTQYFEAKAMRIVKPEEWAAVVVPEKNRHLARVLKDAGIKVLTYSTENGISTRSMVINEFAEQEHIKFSMMDQQGDDTQQGRTAAEAEDEWNLYSDVAGTDDNAYQLINNLIALRTRETENADGRIEHKTGAWKGQIGKQVETIAQQYGNGNKGYVERKLRALYNEMDGLATEYGARSFVDESLRAARTAVREIYGSQEENRKRDDLKEFFGGRTIYLDQMVLDDAKMGEGGLKGLRSRFATVNLKVTTKQKDGAFHLESEWEEAARRFGLDPDISNPADQLMELDEMISNVSEYGGINRTLTADEDRILDLAALDLVSGWIMAGSTPVVQRTVTHIDQEHQQKALDRIDELEAQVSEQADTIESQAQQLADEKAKTRTVLDQLFKRAHELEDLKRSGANRAELDEARKAYAELANKHAETVKENKSLEKKLEKAREKHRELHRELSEARKAEKEAESKAEKLQQRVEKQKERLEEKLEKQKDQLKQQKAKAKAAENRRRMVERIRKTGRKLGRMLASPKQNKYVPQDMVRAAADFVDALLDNTGRNSDKAGAKLQRMIREARSSSDYNVAHSFDETLENQLNQVNELLNDKGALRNMSDGDIALIAGTAEQLMHQINEAGKLQGRQDKADIMEEATDAVKTLTDNPRELNGLKGVVGNYLLNHKNPQRVFRALAGYKDNAVARLGNELSEGQRRKNMLTMKATKCFEELTRGKNAKNFLRFTGEDQSGWTDIGVDRLNEQGKKVGTYKMTGEMKASFALHWASEENRKGMSIPGNKDLYQLVMPDENLMKKGKVKEAYQRGSRMTFTSAQARAIIDSMTEYEQKWVAAWRSMEAILQPAINETSMTLKHYRIATVENYFPIHRDRAYIASDFESIVMDRSLENMGFTKERVNARNPMLLEGLTDVINTQINSVSDYVGYAVPVKNFNKVYNAVMPGYADSVKAALYRTQGKEVAQYLEKLMSDIQGGQHREASFLDKLRGKYAGAVLTLNPAVTIKQAASYPTAASVLGWNALNKALPYFANSKAISTDLIDTYTSAHWERRSEALKDAEGNAKNASAVRKSANKFLNSIQEMDVLTTKVLWKAAEFRVQETTKLRPGSQEDIKNGTDAYYQAVARLYEQAIEETQPEYGVMQRPQILRHDSEIVRSLTMFKTQPLQNLGILLDSFGEMRAAAKAAGAKDATKADQEWFARSKQTFTRAVTSQVVSGVVLAIMTMVGKALLHKMDPYRDEKGDITAQSTGKQILSDTLGSWAGMVAGGSEIYELIAGVINGQSPFDIEAAGVSTINDLYQNLYGLLNSATVIGDSSLTASEKWEKIGKQIRKSGMSVAQMLGLPVNNMMNLMDGLATNGLEIATGVGGSFREESALGRIPLIGILLGGAKGRNVSNTKVAPYIAGAMADGDQAEAVRLYNEQLRQGKSGQAVSTAIKTALKSEHAQTIREAAQAIEKGDVTTYNNLINQMTKGGVNMANAVSWVETERKKIGKAGAEENNESAKESAPLKLTYDEIMESLLPANAKSEQYTTGMLTSLQESGNLAEAQKVYKKLLETREASSIQSSMTSYWKPQLVSAYERGDMTEVKRIKAMLMQFGYKEKTISGWTKKKKAK